MDKKEYFRKYRQTEKGKEAVKKYNSSTKGKEARNKYKKSEKGKEAIRRWRQSEKGRQCIKRSKTTVYGKQKRKLDRKKYYSRTAFLYPSRSYLEYEDELILKHDMLDIELSFLLNRSINAIQHRRCRLKKNLKIEEC